MTAQSLGELSLPTEINIQPGLVRDGHVEAQLIGRETALRRGGESIVGVRLKMDEHWHTYWKNPGDSGLATSITWNLPAGVTASEIDWPTPDYFEVAGLGSYAYEGEIVLPVRITVPSDFTGDTVTLTAQVDWLVCRESCEPGEAALTLTLPLVDASSVDAESMVDARWSSLFDTAARRQPRKSHPSTSTHVLWVDGAYRVVVTGPDIARISESANMVARFFPDKSLQIDTPSPQTFEPSDYSGFSLRAEPNALVKHPLDRLTGVVTYQNGDVFHAYEIDEPVRDVAHGHN